MSLKNNKNFVIITLMITIIIDVMGIGLVFPIIPDLVMGSHPILLSAGTPYSMQILAYGAVMIAWPLGIFFGGPFLGGVSDKIGRRRTLLICIFLTAVTYALSAVAIVMHSFYLFICSRVVSGYVSGAHPIAQAAAIDISSPETKVRNLSWISVAAALGLILGPILTGLTAGEREMADFTPYLPFVIAAIVSLLNMASIWVLLRDTYRPRSDVKLHFLSAFTTCKFIFVDKRLWFLALALLLQQAGWGFYVQSIPLPLHQMFGLNTRMMGLFYSVMGCGTFISAMFIQPWLFKRLSLKSMYVVSGICCGAVLMQAVLFPTIHMQWIVMIFAAMLGLVLYCTMMALISNSVTADEQGRAMGGADAIFGLAWIINALLISVFSNIQLLLPTAIGAGLLFLSGVLMIYYKKVPNSV